MKENVGYWVKSKRKNKEEKNSNVHTRARHTSIHRDHTHTGTHKPMSETQSPEVVLVSGGTDLISAVLDTGNDFCQSHLYCNYDMIIMCFIIYMG